MPKLRGLTVISLTCPHPSRTESGAGQEELFIEVTISNQTAVIKKIAEDVYKTLASGFSKDVYDRAMQVG